MLPTAIRPQLYGHNAYIVGRYDGKDAFRPPLLPELSLSDKDGTEEVWEDRGHLPRPI